MVKQRSLFVCQQCEYESTKWFGRCPNCSEWNTAVETIVSTESKKLKAGIGKGAVTKPISLTSVTSKLTKRISTRISELDRVLGGGIVPGQAILIAGEPGIGKSTILLQLADKLAKKSKKTSTLYVSGEESVRQTKIRADRLGIKNENIKLMEETDIDVVIDEGRNKENTFLIIDSIQTMSTSDLSGMAGSVGQVRECAYRLVRLAKRRNVPVFIVGHVTKQGTVAGPSVLMHIVDTVLWFEGDKTLTTRMLRVVKNRFGATDEVGIFEMKDKGLIDISNPEKLFISKGTEAVSGSIVTSILQGTRPILIEVQALITQTKMAYPKRVAQGIDAKRFELLLAVLQRRVGLPMGDYDCFVNVTGGISVKNDPSSDLAICLAVASAYFDKPLAKGTLALGEVGLLGDIREVVSQDKRDRESARQGYKNVISTKSSKYLREVIKKYLK